LAAAVCHFNSGKVVEKSYTGWDAFVKQNEERVKMCNFTEVTVTETVTLNQQSNKRWNLHSHPCKQVCHYCDFHFRLMKKKRRKWFWLN
jgi:coproporphyrinogen III oxidase-like Fe-S oxidoreductase